MAFSGITTYIDASAARFGVAQGRWTALVRSPSVQRTANAIAQLDSLGWVEQRGPGETNKAKAAVFAEALVAVAEAAATLDAIRTAALAAAASHGLDASSLAGLAFTNPPAP